MARRKEQETRARSHNRHSHKRKKISQELREFQGDSVEAVLDLIEDEDDELFMTYEPHLKRARWDQE